MLEGSTSQRDDGPLCCTSLYAILYLYYLWPPRGFISGSITRVKREATGRIWARHTYIWRSSGSDHRRSDREPIVVERREKDKSHDNVSYRANSVCICMVLYDTIILGDGSTHACMQCYFWAFHFFPRHDRDNITAIKGISRHRDYCHRLPNFHHTKPSFLECNPMTKRWSIAKSKLFRDGINTSWESDWDTKFDDSGLSLFNNRNR